jgi:ubiquinone/menaquinone biosynthesis C-methylase UbiE
MRRDANIGSSRLRLFASDLEVDMTIKTHYAIRGGVEGRERLRVLARTLQPSTDALFERLSVGPGLRCLDVGCGGGDVTLELARRVGPHGRVIGADIDETKLDLARQEAAAQRIGNVEFRPIDIRTQSFEERFDLVYARFLLTHLADPAHALAVFYRMLRPGGLLIVEDIDLKGIFVWPETAAFRRYHELFYAVMHKRGGDPDIGPRLPIMLADAGFEQVDLHVVQPMATQGEAKLINPLTLENLADAILHDGLASRLELDTLIQELYTFAADPRTIAGLVRVIQTWGRRPAA